MVRCTVGAYCNSLDRVEQTGPLHLKDVGIVLRDDVAVLWIAAHDEAADEYRAAETEDGTAFVLAQANFFNILAYNGFENACRLLRKNEAASLRGAELAVSEADEFV